MSVRVLLGNLHSLYFIDFSIKSGSLFCVCMVYYRYSS